MQLLVLDDKLFVLPITFTKFILQLLNLALKVLSLDVGFAEAEGFKKGEQDGNVEENGEYAGDVSSTFGQYDLITNDAYFLVVSRRFFSALSSSVSSSVILRAKDSF